MLLGLFGIVVFYLSVIGLCVVVTEIMESFEQGKKDRQKRKEKELEKLVVKILEVMKKEVE